MEIIFTVFCCIVVCCIAWKILDRLIRVPSVGSYKDRYILITGCDTGFGCAAAKRLDELGCNVFAGCLTEKGETELRKVCSESLHTISLDVTKKDSVRKALEFVSSKLPPGRGLWGVLNNAGNMTAWGSPDWFSVDDYRRGCEVNLWGLVDVTLTFLPLVKKAKGRIVNTSSIFGRFSPDVTLPYNISKYGVEAFSDGIRKSLSCFGCKTSIVEPGAHATNMMEKQPYLAKGWSSWENTSPQIKAEYGDEFAKHVIDGIITGIVESAAQDLGGVVDAYEHALLGLFPRARYVVGWDAKCVYWPMAWLPEFLSDGIWRSICKGPTPIVAKTT